MKEYLKTHPLVEQFRQVLGYIVWIMHGKPGSAAHLKKQSVLKAYQKKFTLRVLVETGTYLGEMVYAMRNRFEKIYSIELAHALYEKATKRFVDFPQVSIKEGDSARLLPGLVSELKSPTLFWLDGHYSGGITAKAVEDTPVAQEVGIIFKSMRAPFVILIDDARLFVGSNGYPTLQELKNIVAEEKPGYCMEVDADIIRIFPERV